ncbi:unnamed protein product [Peronospora destructor]|uniref:Uncharacterized protein n=1 Tax=Peronospora destructor TaxID=86335 RepID=A0AAV0UBT6_9STRA|nr:unnamed protein product [Peronospora destructor]
MVLVVTGYFAAFGNGICYTSPVSALQKRFSIYRGAAAGFAVSGFGVRSMALAKAYLPMIARTTVPDLLDVIMYSCAFCLHSLLSSFHVNGMNIHGAVVYETQEESFQRGENVSIMYLLASSTGSSCCPSSPLCPPTFFSKTTAQGADIVSINDLVSFIGAHHSLFP